MCDIVLFRINTSKQIICQSLVLMKVQGVSVSSLLVQGISLGSYLPTTTVHQLPLSSGSCLISYQ